MATLDGELAGYVAVAEDLHTVFGPHAQHLGSYRSFRTASAELDCWPAFAGRTGAPPEPHDEDRPNP